jgi:hypothetical protein
MGWRRCRLALLLVRAAIGSAFEYRFVGFNIGDDSSLFLQVPFRSKRFRSVNANDSRAMQDRIELRVEPFPPIPEQAGKAYNAHLSQRTDTTMQRKALLTSRCDSFPPELVSLLLGSWSRGWHRVPALAAEHHGDDLLDACLQCDKH